ncbi:SanA/YdcF family protein [Aureispira anguillae]|nr:ElyC/SanA/YdcF family protein [Aureispira anguillae]
MVLLSISALLLLVLVIFGADFSIKASTIKQLHQSTETIPYNKVGLLLGTVKYLKNGRLNRYYKYRIEAAVRLFQAQKIDLILVSGDNSKKGYDEPTDMKEDLIKKGIPASKIVLDYAGFRTLDSVVRSLKIFGQKKITVISQQFHNERAIFIANYKGIEAIGFSAQDVSTRAGIKVMIREKFARVKVYLDLLLGVEPKFLGKPIKI